MVRSEKTPLNTSLIRRDLSEIIHAGIAGASGHALVARALADGDFRSALSRRPVTLVAAGKMAVPMAAAFTEGWDGDLRGGVVAAPIGPSLDHRLEFFKVGHPVPTIHSVTAGRRVLAAAGAVGPAEVLLVLLSGGASAALAVPAEGVTLADKVAATDALLRGGVAIDSVNCVRKHLSAIKGGWLTAASKGTVLTLAVSDVVGPVADDAAVIGSGPTAADPTTFWDAAIVADHPAVREGFPQAARLVLDRGCRAEIPDTPKPGDARLAGSRFHVIGNRLDAVRGARRAATTLGYKVGVIDQAVVGDARTVAGKLLDDALEVARRLGRPACVVSAGETTVEVTGSGKGGRNQEMVLAMVDRLSRMEEDVVVASVGTDGVDGPTDAAGAVADRTTAQRAVKLGMKQPASYLDGNDSYSFFRALGDLMITGPTQTNVGDLQVVLVWSDHADG